MNGYDFGHELVSESMSDADLETDMRFFELRIVKSDTSVGSSLNYNYESDR